MARTDPGKNALDLLMQMGISEPPVPVDTIAERLGARIAYQAFDHGMSGLLYRDDTRTIIGVNSMHPVTRQRFTIAHEIGHWRLGKGRPLVIDRAVRVDRRDARASEGIDPDEISANAFAAELLMPATMIASELASVRLSDRDATIRKLGKRFQVSEQAMGIRLVNLGMLGPE